MKIDEVLEDKKIKKESFSFFSLLNRDNLSEEDATSICNKARLDKDIIKYANVVCPKCKGRCREVIYEDKLVGQEQNCFHCKTKFKLNMSHIYLVFETKTWAEKIKEMTS